MAANQPSADLCDPTTSARAQSEGEFDVLNSPAGTALKRDLYGLLEPPPELRLSE